MPNVKKHCNVYGFLGAFTAVTCAVSWFLVNSKGEECIRSSFDQLQIYHMVGIVGGIILCVCGFFNVAGFLYDIIIVFYVATVLIVALGGLLGYAAYFAFWRPCMPALGFIPIDSGLGLSSDRNVFSAEDGKMIGVFILNICSALMFLSASGNFYRRM